MNSSIKNIPFSPGLTLVALVRRFEGRTLSATGIAQSSRLASQLAESEMQERATESSTPLHYEFAGVAAGTSYSIAATRAFAELFERLAVYQWWYKGSALRSPTPGDQKALDRAQSLYQRKSIRRLHVAELAVAPPLVLFVVWSHDAAGRGLCLGFGVSCHRDAAIYKALRELVQMEFSLGLIVAKLRSRIKLSEREASMLDRASGLHLDTYPDLWRLNGYSTVFEPIESKVSQLSNPIGKKIVASATLVDNANVSSERGSFRQWGPY